MKADDFFADVAPKKNKTISADEFFADVNPQTTQAMQEPESDYGRYAGLAGRAAIEGVAGIPAGLYNLASTIGEIAPSLASRATGKPQGGGRPHRSQRPDGHAHRCLRHRAGDRCAGRSG